MFSQIMQRMVKLSNIILRIKHSQCENVQFHRAKIHSSFAGTRTRVSGMRIPYPNHLDYEGIRDADAEVSQNHIILTPICLNITENCHALGGVRTHDIWLIRPTL